jgi:hypothetical protein
MTMQAFQVKLAGSQVFVRTNKSLIINGLIFGGMGRQMCRGALAIESTV